MVTCRNVLIFIVFLLFTLDSIAQLGVRIKYNSTGYPTWDTPFNSRFNSSGEMLTNGFEGGLDYWFRLKKKRIEFMPEIAYAQYNTTFERGLVSQLSMSEVHFNIHTHIYALDLGDDCNCPTFSKEGGTIDKGLFVHFTPGISYHNVNAQFIDSFNESFETTSGISFRAGVGLGVDIGISDLWTVTPIVSYFFRTPMIWKNLAENDDVSTTPNIFQLTLRLGFRPDYKRNYRRR